jgi:hypothetical protein
MLEAEILRRGILPEEYSAEKQEVEFLKTNIEMLCARKTLCFMRLLEGVWAACGSIVVSSPLVRHASHHVGPPREFACVGVTVRITRMTHASRDVCN